jgi:hypothetical protein
MATPATITAERAIQESIAASIAVKQVMLGDHQLLQKISGAAEMIVTSLRAGGERWKRGGRPAHRRGVCRPLPDRAPSHARNGSHREFLGADRHRQRLRIR